MTPEQKSGSLFLSVKCPSVAMPLLKISIISHTSIMSFQFNQLHLPLKLPTSTLLELCVNESLLNLLTDVQLSGNSESSF